MDLHLTPNDIAALEIRTEGWIAGLQLAAISLQGHQNASSFIHSFSGSHRFVLDYLIEEVLKKQPESINTFLLQTSILDRLNGSLCDAVRFGNPISHSPAFETASPGQPDSQAILERLEQANLFVIPLDDERRWYRYHHLFADLLRQRLQHNCSSLAGNQKGTVNEYHKRASIWYENHGLEIDAFHHAAAANDIDRAERLIESDGVPLYFRGALTPVLNWLMSLPKAVLDTKPSLWATYAMTSLAAGQTTDIEEKLQAAEAALQSNELDKKTRDLIGRIANTRANLAVGHQQLETIITQSTVHWNICIPTI